MAGGPDSQQPMTITNAQGQQITVIPTGALQQIRPANANIIQMPNMSAMQAFPVQNIPGLGNVQVHKGQTDGHIGAIGSICSFIHSFFLCYRSFLQAR